MYLRSSVECIGVTGSTQSLQEQKVAGFAQIYIAPCALIINFGKINFTSKGKVQSH